MAVSAGAKHTWSILSTGECGEMVGGSTENSESRVGKEEKQGGSSIGQWRTRIGHKANAGGNPKRNHQ